jgi:hypothetical protein
MPFWKQVVEAIQCQIEDFFRVPWQLIVLMLIVIAGVIDFAYVRTAYGLLHRPPFWSVHALLQATSFLTFFGMRRLFK